MLSNRIDPRKVFQSAVAFHETANLLTDLVSKQGHDEYHYPRNVNLALAAELYIKSILYHDGVTVPQHHDLQLLFNQLKKTHRQRIEKGLRAEVLKIPHIPALEKTFGPFQLANILNATKDAFQIWRYIFEPQEDTIQFFGLEELCSAIRPYILSISPNWRAILPRRLRQADKPVA